MLTELEIEHQRNEARWKAQMDHNALMKAAQRLYEEGLEQGKKMGIIQLCESILGRAEVPMEQLAKLPIEELTRLAEGLELLARAHYLSIKASRPSAV